jgi:amino acid adenylation domain-containing protein
LFERRCDVTPQVAAVDPADGSAVSFAELDGRANQLARYLTELGVGVGDRVGLLLDDAVWACTGMLAVLKAGAAFVPLDPAPPTDRLVRIVEDAEPLAVLTLARLSGHLRGVAVAVVCVDDASTPIAGFPAARLSPVERRGLDGGVDDALACVVYPVCPPGSTGRPTGVAIDHPGVVNAVRVAGELVGVGPGDRMYPGMTTTAGFSVEQVWVAWAAGATLVPEPTGAALQGADLHEYLQRRRVTALCCPPATLATIEEEGLADLRLLLVPGGLYPAELAARWQRPGRRFLNVYGSAEAPLTATVTTMGADPAIGVVVPLPTCSVVVLDPDDPRRVLPRGTLGELGIAGPGLARGYLNRDDVTVHRFVPDLVGLPADPSGRIFRTGDRCRITEHGEIEYHGRIDLQVESSGRRVEPSLRRSLARTGPVALHARSSPVSAAALIALALPSLIAVALRIPLPGHSEATTHPAAAPAATASAPSATGTQANGRTTTEPPPAANPSEKAGSSARRSTVRAPAGTVAPVLTALPDRVKTAAQVLTPMGPAVAQVSNATGPKARTAALQSVAPPGANLHVGPDRRQAPSSSTRSSMCRSPLPVIGSAH